MRIFISYNNKDASVAEQVAQALGAAKAPYKIYFAKNSNSAGDDWIQKQNDELDLADVVVLLLGNQIGNTQILEYKQALKKYTAKRKPRIVPVLLDNRSPDLPYINLFHQVRMGRQPLTALIDHLQAAFVGADQHSDALPLWRETNPYRGLYAMRSADAAWFFGREALTGHILELMRTLPAKVLMLVGNSGVGKSSIVEAGVLAALRSQLWPSDITRPWPPALKSSASWLTVSVRPGERPLKALALGLVRSWLANPAAAEKEAEEWVGNFINGSTLGALAEAAQYSIAERNATERPSRILIHIDQGEELYSRSNIDEAARFSDLVAEAAAKRADIAFISSLRADYNGHLQQDGSLFGNSMLIDVPPMTRREIEDVIRGPAAQLEARFEHPELVKQIADVTARESGALPLLSFMMSEAWETMRRDENSGGLLRFPPGEIDIVGPLVRKAEEFFELHAEEHDVLRRLFTLRLAQIPRDGDPVRRKATKADCTARNGSTPEWSLAEELASEDWRLLTTGREGDEPTVEVAHETLLRRWPRLSGPGGWIDDQREYLIWKGRLEADKTEWENAPLGERDGALLMGRALESACIWRDKRPGELPPSDIAFINESERLRQDQEELRRQQSKLGPPMYIERLSDHKLLFFNEPYVHLYNLEGIDLDSFDRDALFNDLAQRDWFYGELAAGREVTDHNVTLRRTDAGEISVSLTSRPILYQGENAIVTTLIDLTALREAQSEVAWTREALHQSVRMTALGALLAGVAHELNNPLSVVVGYSSMLRESATNAAMDARLAKIHTAAERCARIVRTFLSMARAQPLQRKPVVLSEVVMGALDLADYGLRSADVKVAVDVSGSLPPVHGDADQLLQVVVNLIVNAQQALLGRAAPRRLSLRAWAENGEAALEVADNGPGMTPDVAKRAFEPFFTTKPHGVGTGVGLSVCHGIVAAHGGRIELDTAEGAGACFRLRLPLSQATEPEGATPSATASAGGCVLVVDDEPEIVALLKERLSHDGLAVTTASSGRRALAALEAGGVDAVISDLRMPDMDGAALAQEIRWRWPDLADRIVLITGDALGVDPALQARGPIFEKPLDIGALAAEVHRRISGKLWVG